VGPDKVLEATFSKKFSIIEARISTLPL